MSLFRFLFIVICLSIGGLSCNGKKQRIDSGSGNNMVDSALVQYAHGFTIKKDGNVTLLMVSNPWQGAQGVKYHYVLCPKGERIPEKYAHYPVIYTPVERVICLATTHIAMLSALGKTSSIKALSGPAFVSDSAVVRAISDGRIIDIGYDQALNFERIIALKPDVIFAYGVGHEILGSLTRLTDLGLNVVLNAEYLERTALGKAEWLKFMAGFYNCGALADSLFDSIQEEYNRLRELAGSVQQKPTVMCGLPWQGSWYIPGGRTTTANMIADAGGNYLWKHNDSHESYPINIEAIIEKGSVADLWIDTGSAKSLNEIKSVDERLVYTQPWKTGKVYNNYARMSAGGGNDFFESGVVQPHLILKDLIKIFHPDLLPGHQLYYYIKLN